MNIVRVYNTKVIEFTLRNIRRSFIWWRCTRKLVRPSQYMNSCRICHSINSITHKYGKHKDTSFPAYCYQAVLNKTSRKLEKSPHAGLWKMWIMSRRYDACVNVCLNICAQNSCLQFYLSHASKIICSRRWCILMPCELSHTKEGFQ